MAIPLAIIGLGFGLVAAPVPMVVLTEVPTSDAGSASGLTNTMNQLGAAVGIALVSVVFFGPLAAAAGNAVHHLAPTVRPHLAAAGVPADRIATITTASHACAVDRAKEKDPTVVPASCQPVLAAAQDPVVGQIPTTQGKKASGDGFIRTFQIALGSAIAVTLVSFAL